MGLVYEVLFGDVRPSLWLVALIRMSELSSDSASQTDTDSYQMRLDGTQWVKLDMRYVENMVITMAVGTLAC